jgi:hypothetical protein
VVILVFLLLVAIFFSEGKFELPKGVIVALGIIVFIAVVIAVVNIAGVWTYVKDFFAGGNDNSFAANLILILVVVGAVFFALRYTK